jgi:predicted amidohydrolase
MTTDRLTIALISEVFYDADGPKRLEERLGQARAAGADAALLPELPCHPWSPATRQARGQDAEPAQGARWQMQSQAAAAAGIALIGGTIVQDDSTGVRRNTALVFDARGDLLATYCKMHLPREPGFWETDHYEPGLEPATVIQGLAVPVGIQICSDANRPEGTHVLGALGATAVLVPRATELATWDRWRVVFRANALTSCCYVLSVNRPAPESDVLIGGPSIAVDPDGQVLAESTDPITIATVETSKVREAARSYPGYLPVQKDAYAAAWSGAARRLTD